MLMNKINIDNILRVFRTLHRLKELPRQGFIYFRFKGDETDSIAEHSFIVAWIANLLARQLQLIKYANIDESFVHRVTKMGLIHDWSESVFGDLAYVTKSQTLEEIEHQAFKALVAKLEIHEKYRQIRKLWEKFETQKDTLEASIVKFADALDAWIQGLVTPTAWWTAWEDYNRKTENALNEKYNQPELAKIFRRICDLAKYTDVDILLPVQDLILKDDVLQRLLGFIKKIYSLKELPRHGFTIFGMKRCETDSFAAHMFTTASLSYLFSIEMEMSEREQYETIMMAT